MSETFEIARKNMVVNQLRPNKINEENILQIFENTPKENYLDVSLGKNCYLDNSLDITEKRGYLKNLHLAQIIKYSKILPNDKVLHIGGLTGYFSALISSLCQELHVVEENRELFKLLEHNISNAVAASAVAFYLGVEYHKILEGITSFKGIERRAPINIYCEERLDFNEDINDWDVGSVVTMVSTFRNSDFNQPLNNWDTSNVTNMGGMFVSTQSFNQPIGDWDTSNVTNMIGMFQSASAFNQNLNSWDVEVVESCAYFSYLTPQWTLPQPNFTNCNP